MSQFPYQLDSDVDLPRVDDNITLIGALAINSLRAAMFNVEANIGIGAAGAASSIAQRLNVSLDPSGNILPSALVNLLTIVQITNAQVASGAAIQESKLSLSYSTASLYSVYQTLKVSVDNLNGFLSLTGVKLEPHIDGTDYNHLLSAILVDPTTAFVKVAPSSSESAGTNVINRNTTNSDTLVQDISNDLVVHEKSDSTSGVSPTAGGTVPPENFAHVAAGIYVNPASFTTIPQANDNVQSIIDYVDSSSLLLLGSRVQNFYADGVSRTSRSTSLLADGYGSPIVPPTPVTAYFLGVPPGPPSSSPVDSFLDGDDVIIFDPTSSQLSTFTFDAQFAQVQPGDLLTINYGTGITYQFAVDSVKSIVVGSVRTYGVRINGKNPISDGYAVARIDSALFNRNKYAVLATSRAPSSVGAYESLIVANPRSAVALGNGFNPSQFDSSHYNLYLTLLPNGDLTNVFPLPPIDATGNQGATPGNYTLDTVVDAINTAFRAPGYNFRFTAFEFEGQIGLALDPYNNASFSIISGVVDGYGNYDAASNISYPNNVVDNYKLIDPMGFGIDAANVASPPPVSSYPSIPAAEFAPTLLFYPLKRNYFYANGSEIELLKSDPLVLNNIEDVNGDGYWPATIATVSINPTTVSVVYTVNLDLAESGLAVGKTLVVQPIVSTTSATADINYGRFVISNVVFNNMCTSAAYTNITVYDAVHGTGISPFATLPVGTQVNIYFSDDSVSFDAENVFDGTATGPFKRFFEVYVDGNAHTTTHERARFLTTGSDIRLNGASVPTDIASINLYGISPKLKGYLSPYINGNVIYLSVSSYNATTGQYVAALCSSTFTNLGPTTTGKLGEVVRFYDFTNVDYIDFIYNVNATIAAFTSSSINTNKNIAIQLFPSLELNQQFMIVATCQVNDSTKTISYLEDARQFGNVSEEQLTTSALDFITSNPRETMQNGVVRGFDLFSTSPLTLTNIANFDGGLVLVNGNLTAFNPFDITIPLVQDDNGGSPLSGVLWAVCANKYNEIQLIPLTDYNASVNTINNPNRLLKLYNPINANAYYVDSTTFTTLIDTRKDLAVLWLVNAQVVASGNTIASYSLTLTDARKYTSNVNANNNIILTSSNSQGNFNSFAAINNWLTYNSSFQNNVVLRGNYTFATDPGFTGNTVYQGDGYTSSLVFSSSVSFPSGSVFNNCNFVFNNGAIFTNASFNDCNISFNAGTVSFNNATISSSTINIAVSFPVGSSGLTVLDSVVNSTITNALQLGNNFRFERNTFNWNAQSPVGDGTYSHTDLLNVPNGLFHASLGVSQSLSNVKIRDCIFNTSLTDRYAFISCQFTDITAYAQNIDISHNQFIATLANNEDDLNNLRGAVVFTSMMTTASTFSARQYYNPTLFNVSISDNYCSSNQMIAITSVRSGGIIVGPLLAAVGCKISNNICGAISFITAATSPYNSYDFDTGINGLPRDKSDQLLITNNTCKIIANIDSTGQYISFRATFPSGGTQTMAVGAGPAYISGNTANWIQVGAAGLGIYTTMSPTTSYDGMTIVNNQLSPSNPAILANYTEISTGVLLGNYAITLRREFNGGGSTLSVISGNKITQKPQIQSNGTAITYYYDQAIVCLNSANVNDNIVDTVLNTSSNATASALVLWGSGIVNATGNTFIRGGLTIQSYVFSASGSAATNPVRITNNIFDSIFVDAGNSIENPGQTIPQNWVFANNKNQIAFRSIDMNNLSWFSYGTFSASTAGGVFPSNWYSGFYPFDTTGILSKIVAGGGLGLTTLAGTSATLAGGEMDINQYLPPGAQLLYLAVGANSPSNATTATMQFQIAATRTSAFVPGSFSGTMADPSVSSGGGPLSALATSNSLTIDGTTVPASFYCVLDTSSNNLFVNQNFGVVFGLTLTFNDSMIVNLSPLVLKFVY